jgi:hypothetical protein
MKTYLYNSTFVQNTLRRRHGEIIDAYSCIIRHFDKEFRRDLREM